MKKRFGVSYSVYFKPELHSMIELIYEFFIKLLCQYFFV